MEKLIRWFAVWIWKRYPYMLQEIVVGHSRHIHKNPRKKPTAVVTFPDGVHPYDAAVNRAMGFPDIKNSKEERVDEKLL